MRRLSWLKAATVAGRHEAGTVVAADTVVVPWNDPHRDIQRKLAVEAELFLVGCLKDQIVASVMAGSSTNNPRAAGG